MLEQHLVQSGPLNELFLYLDIKSVNSLLRVSKDTNFITQQYLQECIRREFNSYVCWDRLIGGLQPSRMWMHIQPYKYLSPEQTIVMMKRVVSSRPFDKEVGYLCLRLSQLNLSNDLLPYFYQWVLEQHMHLELYAVHGLLCLCMQKNCHISHDILRDMDWSSVNTMLTLKETTLG